MGKWYKAKIKAPDNKIVRNKLELLLSYAGLNWEGVLKLTPKYITVIGNEEMGDVNKGYLENEPRITSELEVICRFLNIPVIIPISVELITPGK